MKKSRILFTSIMALTFIVAFSSCSKEVLVTKKEVRNLNLVKIGAPDPTIPCPTALQKVVVQKTTVKIGDATVMKVEPAETVEDIIHDINGIIRVESEITRSHLEKKVQIPIIPFNLSKKGSKAAKKMANVLDKHSDFTFFQQNTVEKKELKDTSVNLLRLLLYILLALLVISVLGIILPNFIVTIIVLVLLIAGVLYLLEEL